MTRPNPFEARRQRKQQQDEASASLPAQPGSGLPPVAGGFSNSSSGSVAFAQDRADKMMTLDDLPDPVETHAEGPLTEEEEAILELCMRGIKQFETAWWVMAKAMANINARRLYRKTHPTFEAFAKDVYDKSRPTAYEEITAYAVGELMSARADIPFESQSNGMSARADIGIGKKAAIALNPITNDYGAEASVAVHETIQDATGKKATVKELKAVITQLPRKADKELSRDELTALAREAATGQTRPGTTPSGDENQAPAVAGLRTAVTQLEAAYRALTPAKIKQALEEAPDVAAELLAAASTTADAVRRRLPR